MPRHPLSSLATVAVVALATLAAPLVLVACDEAPDDPDSSLTDGGPGMDGAPPEDGSAGDDAGNTDGGGLDGGPPAVSCADLTDDALRAHGYEPVRAHGAVGDGTTDDTAAIQAAIEEANRIRRSVYFHPGEYLVTDTLEVRQDVFMTRGSNSDSRYGMTLQGSYCGDRPTLRLADGVATETSEAVISAEPTPLLLLMRDTGPSTPPDGSNGSRDWNQVVRNLHLVLGDNPGAVGIRHHGAEGSSAQEVSIDARGAFAGFYHLNCSGGYTYGIEVRGGRYGLYLPRFRGGSPVIIGLVLYEQEVTPFAFDHYAPLTIIGFDIQHDDGRVISTIAGAEGSYTVPGEIRPNGDAGGHLALVDGRIDIAGDQPALANTNRSIYLKNVWVRGVSTILRNRDMGNLDADTPGGWSRVGEYSVGGATRMVAGASTLQTFFDGAMSAPATGLSVSAATGMPPADLVDRHLYEAGLCNVEAGDMVFVQDHGADPDDGADDTAAIQAAIDAAEADGSNRVFLSAASGAGDGSIAGGYRISDTLQLGSRTRLCGVSRYASILDATGWTPSADAPVIATPDDADATTAIADFLIELAPVGGNAISGFEPHAYALRWRSGRGSLYRDVFYRANWGEPGPRRMVHVEGNGGGRWFGVTQQGPYPPALVGGDERPYRDSMGRLTFSTEYAHMDISGTSEPLTFYTYHSQHATPPRGALTWIRDASNVTFYGVKSEMGATPERMAEIIRGNTAADTPVWMFIRRSSQISIIGHESHAQVARGRGLIEITDGTDIQIVHYGRRSSGSLIPDDEWYFFEEDNSVRVAANGFVSLYLSD